MKPQYLSLTFFSVAFILFATAGQIYYDTYVVPRCEVCGMSAIYGWRDVVTPDGKHHVACCPFCTLLLIHKYETMRIETLCDYCGKEIVIEIVDGSLEKVTPPAVHLILAGTGLCKQNKIACSLDCGEKLLAEAPPGSKLLTIKEAYRTASEPLREYLLWHPTTWPLILELAVLGLLILASGFAVRKILK